jgi:G:T-mismatch repair DNA endonuclease (very short patch repair protein)
MTVQHISVPLSIIMSKINNMETETSHEFRKVLIKQGFTEYRHKDGYTVWSKTDLFATDDMKVWFLA